MAMIELFIIISISLLSGCGTKAQTITLSSSVPAEQLPHVCSGHEIVFMCKTRGSPTLSWRSNQYIEPGGDLLQLDIIHAEGYTETSSINSDTVANLTRNSMENGVQILESKLRILTLPDFPSFSVSCLHGNTDERTSSLQLLDDPGVPVDMTSEQRRGDTTGRCVVHLSWASPTNIANEDVTGFMIFVNGTERFYEENNVTKPSIMTAYHMCDCATHSVSVRAVNRCGRMSSSATDFIMHQETAPTLHELDICTYSEPTESNFFTNDDDITTIDINVNPTSDGNTNNAGCQNQASRDLSDNEIVGTTVGLLLVWTAVIVIISVVITYFVTKHMNRAVSNKSEGKITDHELKGSVSPIQPQTEATSPIK